MTALDDAPLTDEGMLAPLVREIGRIAAVAEDRELEHLAEIRRLEEEVSRLRETVAHLRTSTAPVPAHLRVVVARAMCEVTIPASWTPSSRSVQRPVHRRGVPGAGAPDGRTLLTMFAPPSAQTAPRPEPAPVTTATCPATAPSGLHSRRNVVRQSYSPRHRAPAVAGHKGPASRFGPGDRDPSPARL